MGSLFLTRQTVIFLGAAAAISVTIASWMRIRHGGENGKITSILTHSGYALLGLSILIHIILGFR